MSTYLSGRIVAVDQRRIGRRLVSDHPAGVSTLTVKSTHPFDEDGGSLQVNGQVIAYTGLNDETGELFLSGTLEEAAEEGDRVLVYDVMYQRPAIVMTAQVELDEEDDQDEPVEAMVAHHLQKDVTPGLRGGTIPAEAVLLDFDEDDDEWRVVDILGLDGRNGTGNLFWRDVLIVGEGAGSWAKTPGPVLSGNGTLYEKNSVYELEVLIPDPTGQAQIRGWYGGGWADGALHTATSDDAGLTWTRQPGNPVVGWGNGGEPGYCGHASITQEPDGTIHAIYANSGDMTVTPLYAVISTDGGLTFGNRRVILTAQGWEKGVWGNSSCVIDDSGTWHLLYEGYNQSNVWQMGYATSPDGVTWTRQNGGQPITSLQVGTGMFGGPDLHKTADGWELFYHASTSGLVPTDIYHATSTDLINWTRDPDPILTRTQAFEVDQVADPTVVIIDGTRVMFFSGMDNPNQAGKIGRAAYTEVTGEQTMTLTHEPLEHSEHLRWHPGGGSGLFWDDDEWSRAGKQMTITDPAGLLEAGDKFTVKYAYLGGPQSSWRTVVPWQSTGWKVLQVPAADTTDYSGVGVDDSGWATRQAPISNSLDPHPEWEVPAPRSAAWPANTGYWLRRAVDLEGFDAARVSVRVDNFADIYWNGTLIGSAADTEDLSGSFDVPAALFAGSNTLAIRCDDDTASTSTDRTYIDVEVEARS